MTSNPKNTGEAMESKLDELVRDLTAVGTLFPIEDLMPLCHSYATQAVKEALERATKKCLDYCQEQNGMRFCKNCGLDQETIDEITKECE